MKIENKNMKTLTMKPSLLQQGFTLIEVMIVVAVIGILASIAFPSYTEYVRRADRAEARTAIMKGSQQLERRFTELGAYPAAADFPKLFGLAVGATVKSGTDNPSTGKYVLTYAPAGTPADSFVITASRVGGGDIECGNLTYTNLGQRDRTGTNWSAQDCWRR